MTSTNIFGGAAFSTNGADLQSNLKQNPGLILSPVSSEVGGLYTAFREIAGGQWFMQNADYGAQGFFQPNQTKPSFAWQQPAGGGFSILFAAAGSAPGFTWTTRFAINSSGVIIIGSGGGGGGVSGTATKSTTATSSTFVQLLASNALRLGATIFNDTQNGSSPGSATLYLGYGSAPASLNLANAVIAPNSNFIIPAGFTGAIFGAWRGTLGGNGAQVVEFTA